MAEVAENGHAVASENAAPEDNKLVTVFDDADEFNVKHPLMHEWTLWFTKPPSGKVCFGSLSLGLPVVQF